MFVQALESRRLMAASAVVANHVLTVTGTEKADTIEVRLSPNFVPDASKQQGWNFLSTDTIVRVNGRDIAKYSNTTADYQFRRIIVLGLGGDDKIAGPSTQDKIYRIVTANGKVIKNNSLSSSFKFVVNAGDGNDTIYGGQGNNDSLFGGAGNDTITAIYGSNYIDGGAGNDRIYAVDTHTYLKGGTLKSIPSDEILNDTIIGGSGHDRVYHDKTDVLDSVEAY